MLLLSALLLVPGLGPLSASGFFAVLQDDGLNRHDTERVERGYYEHLIGGGHRASAVEPAPFDAGRLCATVDDLRAIAA